MRFADRIAYINHDIDDAVRAGRLNPDDIPHNLTEVLGTDNFCQNQYYGYSPN